ncbi:alpha/beta hydrolase [Nitratireductor mangrovi]|uniref:Alpha/beta hydrolase n=1 Tax=Nitratireductor mangrovi TaxID=2599600 RepID=A0A5B8KVR2_9HYPH|nr:alpha/beta fold hydrolase [Nitratireductor mangrovi]QDY99674.1 alpha/beta hydrolase [Nitratireductor mangrovi]
MRRMAIAILVIAVALAAAWFFGPRVSRNAELTFDPAAMGSDVEAWLAESEAKFPDIKDGLAKEIVWAFPASKARTPLAIVYVHGFSASKGEIRPVPDRVAEALGANLFFTRLAGHGRGGPAMADGSVNAWINDYAEALAIGHRLGERVVVIATSTGATIAAWAATRPAFDDEVAGLVLVSPNFGIQAGGATLLTGPWGLQLARLLVGAERGFEPVNEAHERLWTTRYPTEALLPMAAFVDMAAGAPVEKATTPALFIYSDKDAVVRADITDTIAARWGAAHEELKVEDSGDPSNHVIAGDALSPATTEPVANRITEWIRKTVE